MDLQPIPNIMTDSSPIQCHTKYIIPIISIINILAISGQTICLPGFIDSFSQFNLHSNPFFVLCYTSFFAMLYFIILSSIRYLLYDVSLLVFSIHKRLLLISLFDASYDLLFVYASSSTRTPVDLQIILGQSFLPFTFIASYIIKHEIPTKSQIFGMGVIVFGILICLIPSCLALFGIGHLTLDNFMWCLVYIGANLFCALCNVYQDCILKTNILDIGQLLMWTSIYKFFILCSMFWTGFIPGFGFNTGITQWSTEMWDSIQCYMGACPLTYQYGICYIILYIIAYTSTTCIIKYRSANYFTLISTLTLGIVITFWLIFPHLNTRVISILEIICDYISVLIICIGIFIYTSWELYETRYNILSIINE